MERPAPDTVQSMAELRVCIDAIDDELIKLLAERERYTDRAPALKEREGISARAPNRFQAVLDNVRSKAEAQGFDAELAEEMWRLMIEAVIAREEAVIGTGGKDG